jgi:NAD(P)-dependent dehydrogenase (short-subunit alcohol dehydrogenase family)
VVANDRKVAIVTGAARPWGLGRAVAVALIERGYDIAIADLRPDWGAEAVTELSRDGASALFVETDISSREQVFAMVAAVEERFGRIDALVNCAAISVPASTEEFDDAIFHRVIDINLLGSMLCTQAVIPAMKGRHYGRVVNIASTAPYLPQLSNELKSSVYSASKAAVVGWTKAAAVELAAYGIVVNVVAVGGISTAMGSESGPDQKADAHQFTVIHHGMLPWGRILELREAADTIAYVADAPNHALLGATIHASGGRVMPL